MRPGRYRACRLCKPHKAAGNRTRDLPRRLRRALDAGRLALKER
jgi:hypothetical protein